MTAWTQPRGDLRLNENSPLARGLLWVQVGHLGLDSVKGGRPTLADGLNPVTNGVSLGAGDGISAEWVSKSGSSNVRPVIFDSRRVHEELSKDDKWTLFVVRRTSGTQPSSAGLVTVPYTDSSWGVPFALLCIRRRASLNAFQVINGYGGSWEAKNFSPNNPPFEDSAWHTVAFTRDGGEFASYKNGFAGSTVSGNAGAQATSADTNQEVIVQATGSGFEYTEGETAFVGIWNRVLTPNEIRSLNDDPYQVLRPAVSIPRFAPAGGGVFTLTADAGSFTLAGVAADLDHNAALTAGAGAFVLTGVDASLSPSIAADSGSFTLTGVTANLSRNLILAADQASFSMAGQDADLNRTVLLAADPGAFTLTGIAAGLSPSLAAGAGDFTLTGIDATLTFVGNATLTADPGAFTLTGVSADLSRSLTMDAAVGAFTLTGVDATLSRNRILIADAGAFTLTGIDAGLKRDLIMAADTGSFTLTGVDATLTVVGNTTMPADTGSFSLTGIDADLSRSLVLTADAGTFTLTGFDSGMLRALNVDAGTGAFTLTGVDADLVFAGDVTMTAETGVFNLTGYAARLGDGDEDPRRMQLFMRMWIDTRP